MLDAAEIQRMLQRYSAAPRRSMGQNFVTDQRTISDIVDVAGVGRGSRVLEVGPGLGSLTIALAGAGAEVVALEKDRRLLAALTDLVERRHIERVTLVGGDALTADWSALLPGDGWVVVANLPYNVAVPIILGILTGAPMVESMWVMVQMEVAERLCARPGGRTIGVPTLKVAWHASARIVMEVEPTAFTPVPKVRSAVVELHRQAPPRPDVDPGELFSLVERAYLKRRKMLRSSLAAEVSPQAYSLSGVAPTSRPEELSLAQWSDLVAARHGTAPVTTGEPT